MLREGVTTLKGKQAIRRSVKRNEKYATQGEKKENLENDGKREKLCDENMVQSKRI